MASRAVAAGSLLASALPIGCIVAGAAAPVFGSIFAKDSTAPTAPKTFNDRLDDLVDEIF